MNDIETNMPFREHFAYSKLDSELDFQMKGGSFRGLEYQKWK